MLRSFRTWARKSKSSCSLTVASKGRWERLARRLGRTYLPSSFLPAPAPWPSPFLKLSTMILASSFGSFTCLHLRVLLPGGKTRITAVLEPLAPTSGALMSSAPHWITGAFAAQRVPPNEANSGYSYLATVSTAGSFFVATVWLPPLMMRVNSKRLFLYWAPVT